jgi:hypothetical protein
MDVIGRTAPVMDVEREWGVLVFPIFRKVEMNTPH